MNNQQDSKAAAKLFSPIALAVALTLACQILNASPYSNYDRDPGNVEVWNEHNDIQVTALIDQLGNFSVRLKEPGRYTLSVACKQKGCSSYTVSTNAANAADAPLQSNADGSISYKFTVGKGGLELKGQALSANLPKGAGANGPVSAPVKLQQPPPYPFRGEETGRAESAGVGDDLTWNRVGLWVYLARYFGSSRR